MPDSYIIPRQERLLRPLAGWLLAQGATANRITVIGFVIGLATVPVIASGQFLLGLLLIA